MVLWINEETLSHWEAPPLKQRGVPRKYSDLAIKTILELKFLFNLTLRAAQGLFQSLFDLLGIDIPVPHYSTLSRRLRKLESVSLPRETVGLITERLCRNNISASTLADKRPPGFLLAIPPFVL